jgi:hypothetical protein
MVQTTSNKNGESPDDLAGKITEDVDCIVGNKQREVRRILAPQEMMATDGTPALGRSRRRRT